MATYGLPSSILSPAMTSPTPEVVDKSLSSGHCLKYKRIPENGRWWSFIQSVPFYRSR